MFIISGPSFTPQATYNFALMIYSQRHLIIAPDDVVDNGDELVVDVDDEGGELVDDDDGGGGVEQEITLCRVVTLN